MVADTIGTVIGSVVLLIAVFGPVVLALRQHQGRPREDE